MKIRISRDELSSELSKLQGVVSQRSTLAILSNALLDAKGNTLRLDATDLDISVSTACNCEVVEEGRVTLQAKSLFDIVKNLEDDQIELETEENHWSRLQSGTVNCRIVGTHPDDFPQTLDTTELEMYPIATDQLLDMIDKTLFSVSTDDARPNLTGAFFKLTEQNSLLMVSTDGHRLSKVEVSPEGFEASGSTPTQLRDGIIVPRKGLAELKRNVDARGAELSFGIKDNNIVFKHGPMSLAIRLIDGTFPDFTQVLPKESENKAILPKDVFIQSLKFVSLFASPKTHNVRLSLSDEGLELYATDPDRGEGQKVVPVEYSGPPVKAGYNYRYVLDVLNSLDGDEVSLEIIDTLSPTLIRDTGRDEGLFVVMPMRLDRELLLLDLQLQNFRNIAEAHVEPHSRFNIFAGQNGQGKTNLLEAVYLLSAVKSFRPQNNSDLIRFDQTEATLSARVDRGGYDRLVRLDITPKGKRVFLNNNPVRNLADFFGTVNVVMFGPEDIGILKGSPSGRRRFIDRAIFNGHPAFAAESGAYEDILKQRNALLKSGRVDSTLLSTYDDQLIGYGVDVIRRRLDFIENFRPVLHATFKEIFHDEFDADVAYEMAWCEQSLTAAAEVTEIEGWLAAALERTAGEERDRGFTVVGPHRDELAALLDGRSIKTFGSQGQHRAFVLAMKIAEIRYLEHRYHFTPILMLDDVSSELDRERNRLLFDYLRDRTEGQVFITTTHRDHILLEDDVQVFDVAAGVVTPRQ